MADKQQTRKEKSWAVRFILRPMYITMKQFIKACVNRPRPYCIPGRSWFFPTRSEGAQGSSTSASGADMHAHMSEPLHRPGGGG